MKIRNFKKRKFKIDKKAMFFAFAGCALAICLTIGFADNTPSYSSSDASYDNTNSKMKSNNVQDALDELYQCAEAKSDVPITLSVGDYVEMTPSTSSYTVEPKYTGYSDATETINPKELKLWRVIRVNSDGTVDAVSEYVSSTNVTFKGKTGYQSYIYYLNFLASKYENHKFTAGSRIMGYNGQTEFITDTSYFVGTSAKAGSEWTSSTSGTPAEEYLGRGDSLYQTDYDLVEAAYGGASDSAKANRVGTTSATAYWIGSRYYYWNSSTVFAFNGRRVSSYGSIGIGSNYLRSYVNGDWSDNSNSFALRPIIVLLPGLKATGTGTSSDPYVLK